MKINNMQEQAIVKYEKIGILILFACGWGMAGAQNSVSTPTYNSDVAEIINENCVVCHREGGIGPMQLDSYEEVRPWAPLIELKVASREMPPYAYDHGVGIQELRGDWRLEQSEIDTIVSWVNGGSPKGDQDVAPSIVILPNLDDWNFSADLGQPDLIVPSKAIDIPANGNDLWTSHYVPIGITEDRCIKAVQVKPRGNAKTVVHHANTSIELLNENGAWEIYSELTEYAMGKWGEMVPDDVCRTLPANAYARWRMHFFPGGLGATAPGTMIEDNVVEIGIWLHDDPIDTSSQFKQDLNRYSLRDGYQNGHLIVPPHGQLMTQGFHSFDHPVRIDSYQPHGHLRMRAASMEIFYPETGRTESVSQISKWSATWHHSHIYEPDVAPLLPTGAVLVLKHWYDNTEDNPNNPDPNTWVMGGSRTADEMSHDWIAVTHLDEDRYQELVAARRERRDQFLARSDD